MGKEKNCAVKVDGIMLRGLSREEAYRKIDELIKKGKRPDFIRFEEGADGGQKWPEEKEK
jgi:hypothetical protein